jgi:hypothetical protein
MNTRLLIITFVAVLLVAFSGCTDPDTPEGPDDLNATDLSLNAVMIENVPEGYEYMGMHSLSLEDITEYANASGFVDASEGIYNIDSINLYVKAIQFETSSDAEDFIYEYKTSLKPIAVGEQFVEESFNDHFATRIMKYTRQGGEQVPRYSYIWKNENFVFMVEGNGNTPESTRTLAEATGL